MPRLSPFVGVRYDAARVDLAAVVAPPYDVVGPEQRTVLARRHSANAIRVELPEPDHRAGLDAYQHAAAQWASWREAGTVLADPTSALYAYRMTTPAGRTTNGVLGALGLDDASAAAVLPHEETLPRARSDRLDLLRATRTNLSPVWGLSLAPGLTATFRREDGPDAAATDDDGVLHELWIVDDLAAIEAVEAAVAGAPVVIADGHHRYEVARVFREEERAAGRLPDDGSGADAVLALIVELADDQLAVGAIHRVLAGLPDGTDVVAAFSPFFAVTRAGESSRRTVGALGDTGAMALVLPDECYLLAPTDATVEAGADLPSAMVNLALAKLPPHEVAYGASWQDGLAVLDAGEAQAMVLVKPVTVDQIAHVARAGGRMPPKTSYFWPKPRTGMVFRPLDPPGAAITA